MRPDYASDTVREDGARVIVKPDGTVITIRDGKTTVELPAEILAERQRQMDAARTPPPPKQPAGEKPKPPDFSHLPLAQRPLNVGSWTNELSAREMSNFENSPLVLDGRRFESVEGFYVWLKWSGDPQKQALAQELYSYEAKRFGKSSTNTVAEYDGAAIMLGSLQHHALIERAIAAKLQQHPGLARRFAETHPREIIHDLGGPEAPGRFPARDFCRILTALRQALVDGRLITIEGPVSRLIEMEQERRARTPTWPIGHLLRSLDADAYGRALEEFPMRVVGLVARGRDALIFELPDGMVLKICRRILPPESRRQNVLHIIDQGKMDAGDGQEIQWFTQPKARTPVGPEEMRRFQVELERQGCAFADIAPDKLGIFNGGVKALDPFDIYKVLDEKR